MTAPLPAVAGADADAGQRRQWRGAPGGLTGQPLQRPAPSWRAVGLTALLGLGAAAAVLPVVAARTGGWLVRNDGVAYFLYARALVLEGSTDPTDGYRRLEARSGAGARDPRDSMGPLAALRESLRRVPDTGRVALGLALLVAANSLLMLAFARRTISHQFCVTWSQMAAGVVRALPGTGPEVWP